MRIRPTLAALLIFFACQSAYSADTPYYNSAEDLQRSSDCPKDGLMIISHNAHDLGRSKSDEAINGLASLFRPADVIAIQEVTTGPDGSQAVAKIVEELRRMGNDWSMLISAPGKGEAKEKFAFIYKKSRIEEVLGEDGESIRLWTEQEDGMSRPPCSAIFKPKKGGKDKTFELISVHLAPKNKDPQKELQSLVSGSSSHRLKRTGQIFLGDFNLGPKKIDAYLHKGLGFSANIFGKTSLSNKENGDAYLANAYDNIYIEAPIEVCAAGIIDTVNASDSLGEAREISDHLPVAIIIK